MDEPSPIVAREVAMAHHTKKMKANSVPKPKKQKNKKLAPPKESMLKDGRGGKKSPNCEKKKKKKKDARKSSSASSSPSSSVVKKSYSSAIIGNDWGEVYRELKDRVWQDKPKEEWKVGRRSVARFYYVYFIIIIAFVCLYFFSLLFGHPFLNSYPHYYY